MPATPQEFRLPSPVTELHSDLLERKGLRLSVKRDDLIHPVIQGNKWRKLKHNLEAARQLQYDTLLTFGGPWSNHIHATAAAAQLFGFQSVGIIRGLSNHSTPTLDDAQQWGMKIQRVSRAEYDQRLSESMIHEYQQTYQACYLIPEGGRNPEGARGCAELIDELDDMPDVICIDVGTGTTLAGVASCAPEQTQVIGFNALKNAISLETEIIQTMEWLGASNKNNWLLNHEYHFGGFADTTDELNRFIVNFRQEHGILLEPVYSGKMFYGIFDLIERDYFAPGTHILAVHGGGLQGLRGFPELEKMLETTN